MVVVFPLGLTLNLKQRTVITKTLIAASVLFALAQLVFLSRHQFSSDADERWFSALGFVPASPNWWSPLTAMVTHAGFEHFIVNLVCLWLFVRCVEAELGVWRFALLVIIAQILALLGHSVMVRQFVPQDLSSPIVGASAIVAFGMGASLVRFPHEQIRFRIYRSWRWQKREVFLPLFWLIALWLLWQLGIGVQQIWTRDFSVAVWGHLTGFAFGILVALAAGWHRKARFERWRKQVKAVELNGIWSKAAFLWQRIATESKEVSSWLATAYAFLQVGGIEQSLKALQQATQQPHWSEDAVPLAKSLLTLPALWALPPTDLFSLAVRLEQCGCFSESAQIFLQLSEMANFEQAPLALLKAAELNWRLGDEGQARQQLHRFFVRFARSEWSGYARQLALQIRASER